MKTLLPLPLLLLSFARPATAQSTAPAPAHSAAGTAISGRVRDTAGQPLPGVNVFLKGSFDGVSTDSLGGFSFDTRLMGSTSLVVAYIGHEPQELPLTLGQGPISLPNIRLKASRAALGDVVVTAGAFEASDEKRSSVLNSRDVLTTAGALADVAGALNTLPGTSRNGEEGKLFVRGGAAGETKQFMDGLALQSAYTANVSGSPARGRFSPTLFKGTVFSTGGYSAEYGQALSAAVILNSNDLAPETQTGITLLSLGQVGLSQTQRWERASVAVTGDYMNMQPYFGVIPQLQLTAHETMSSSVAYRQRTGEGGMFKAYGVVSKSHSGVRTPTVGWENGQPVDLQNTNAYLNTSFRSHLRGGWSVNTGLAATRDEQHLNLGVQAGAPTVNRLHELEQSVVGRVVLTNDSVGTYWNLKIGAEGLGQHFAQQVQMTGEGQKTDLPQRAFDEQRAAGFAEANIAFTSQLAGRVGARAEYSALLNRWNAAPRLALAYQLNEDNQVSAAFGHFYQTPANDLLLSGQYSSALRFERADHYLLTYQRLTSLRTLRVEGYYKDYRNLLRFDAAQPYRPATYQSTGSGYARGVDFFFRDRKTVPKLDYWVSYGLLDTKRQQRTDPAVAMPTFASRHNVSVVGKYWFNKLHTLVGATFNYSSPRLSYDPAFQAFRTPSYQEFSMNLSYVTTIRKNYTIVHVSCSNLLGRENVFGYRYGAAPTDQGSYQRVPVLPSAPRMVFVALMISINKARPADTNVAPE
ncbi:TonB-dependent receptor [Hymenobacter arizonensis]|uniref:Outer membrane cobalamin receptor protein n=1 Tax=Hymenobacter arizonensis TaxID=1227077 RepID=A0A1I5SJE8_HYMAR|nr:TonB-dependent receptor [Hymenobacter arizonensis]SFP70627.1 Outer membrane cobalamin receptor protein [Hymenobacter arizonensis]